MKRVLLTLLTLLAFSCTHPAPLVYPTAHPNSIHEVVRASLGRITIDTQGYGQGTCTAQSIAPKKFLTAAHCSGVLQDVEGNLINTVVKIDGILANVIKQDPVRDLAIILADEVKPEVQFRDQPLDFYEDVYGMGFGEGFTQPIVTSHRALLFDYTIADGIFPGIVYQHPFIGGMSGGVVYDRDGKVVGMIQRRTADLGYGVNTATIKQFLTEG